MIWRDDGQHVILAQNEGKLNKLLEGYVNASFKVTKLATLGQQGIILIQELVIVANLWLGAPLGDILNTPTEKTEKSD